MVSIGRGRRLTAQGWRFTAGGVLREIVLSSTSKQNSIARAWPRRHVDACPKKRAAWDNDYLLKVISAGTTGF